MKHNFTYLEYIARIFQEVILKKSLYAKILVPIDGSKYSEKALVHACDLAKKYKSSLSTVYVVDKSVNLDLFDRREYLKILRKYGKKSLEKASKVTASYGITSKQILKEGKVSDELIKLAKSGKYNLLVVGSRGLGSFQKFLLGSVSAKLANNSHCSIFIVK